MPVYLDCVVCGKEFSVPPSRSKTAKACSNECAKSVRAEATRRGAMKTCPECGDEFHVPNCHKGRRKFCSYACRDKNEAYRREISLRSRGEGNALWKGGRHIRRDGYVYRNVDVGHPLRSGAGYILEHRKVMEDWLLQNDPSSKYLIEVAGRRVLSPNFQVHHIDEDKGNNRIENLICLTPADHQKLHALLRRNNS